MHINKFRKYYFINKFETNNIDRLDSQTVVIYRNYNNKISNTKLILKIKKYCKKKRIKFLIANNVRLAIKLDLDGVYIPSFNKSTEHLSFSIKKKFTIIGSISASEVFSETSLTTGGMSFISPSLPNRFGNDGNS